MAINQGLTDAATSSLGPVVRVTIPAAIFHKLDAMNSVTRKVLGQLGCEACHSGFDIRYDVIREFIVDETGNVHAPTVGGSTGPSNPANPAGGGKTAR
jgi:hypothetical protein